MDNTLQDQILRDAEQLMSLTTDAESRLIKQMDRLTEAFGTMAQKIGEMSAHVEHLSRTQEDGKEFGTRLTKLETKADTNKEWIERAGTNNRWLIALCVGTLVACIGMALKVFGH